MVPRHAAAARASSRPRVGLVALVVVLAYLVAACLVFWPSSPLDASHLPNGVLGDPDEAVWFLAWTPWALIHGHNPFLTHALDAPSGVNLADNTAMPLLGLLVSPVTALLGPIAAFNLALRLALASAAAAAFFVFRRWTTGNLGPAVGGAIFGFGPALVSHLQSYGHLNLVAVALLPLLLGTLDELFVRRRRPPWQSGALLGLLAAAQYFVSAELLADAAVLAAVGGLVLAVRSRRHARQAARELATGLGVALGVFALLAGYPIVLALAGPGHLLGPVQARAHLQRFRLDLLEAVLPTGAQWLDPGFVHHASASALRPITVAGGGAETGGYLSLPLLAGALVGGVHARRRPIVGFAGVMATVAFVCSLGSRLQVAGHVLPVPLPEAILSRIGPLASAVPARYAVFTLLLVALVLAVGLDVAIEELRRMRRPAALATVALAALSLLGLAPAVPVSSERPALSPELVAAVRSIVPADTIALAYPYPEPPYAEAMLLQAEDHFAFALVGGYANVRGPDGTSTIAPPLSPPDYVQEFLAQSEAPRGRRTHYPSPAPVRDPDALLCRFLADHGVGAVFFTPFGPGSSRVLAWFRSTLGSPSASADGLTVWRGVGTCRAEGS